jgi:ribosomal protein S18 acetylase RimI-like enzyme
MRRRPFDLMRDYDKVLAIHRASWQINFPDSPFSEPAFRSVLAKGQRRGGLYVYEQGGELLGWLWLDFGVTREAHVRQIQVDEAHWGEGLGHRIMEDAIALCVARRYRTMTLAVTKSNARAVALYTNLGFRVTEDQKDRQRMQLDLPAPALQHGPALPRKE